MITDYEHMGEEAQKLDKAANDPTLSKQAQADKATALTSEEAGSRQSCRTRSRKCKHRTQPRTPG